MIAPARSAMLYNATSLNQDIGSWDVGNVTDMTNVLVQGVASLSTKNYDALLAGWNAQPLQPNVIFDAGYSTYCNSELDRNDLIAGGWMITDGGLSCP